MTNSYINNPRGSVWHRWDPHIHAPGTILNNQFRGDDPWGDFLTKIENFTPRIKALGITDYYSLALYEEVIKYKRNGRLPDVDFIFPNIELRFQIGTVGGSPVNFHILFSPHDPNHVDEIKGFLNHLTFRAGNEEFHCNKDSLIKLGRKHKSDCEDDQQALEEGTNQFKVDLNQFREKIDASEWFQENALIALPASSKDGTAGLQQRDSSFASTRIELERIAHIIFSANPNTIGFWLGKGQATKEQLRSKWGGVKPCLHGSDAHDNDSVGTPYNERYTWIKGDLNFEALHQTVIEPEGRVYIGESSPVEDRLPSYTISCINVEKASWLKTLPLPLNSGLITVIGARGSGKTALADLIAVGAGSDVLEENTSSFIKRADELLKDEKIILEWADGGNSRNRASMSAELDPWKESRVQYLSQQFVERLCSSEGLTDDLMKEVERVIFEAHHPSDQSGANTFQDLLQVKSTSVVSSRKAYEQQIKDFTEERNTLLEKKESLPVLRASLKSSGSTLTRDKTSRKDLLIKSGSEVANIQYQEVTEALDKVRIKLDAVTKKYNRLESLKNKYTLLRDIDIPGIYRAVRQEYADAGLTDQQWENFQLDFKGDVEKLLIEEIKAVKGEKNSLSGDEVAYPEGDKLEESLIPDGASLEKQPYNLLKAELERLQTIIGINREKAIAIRNLSKKIVIGENIYKKLETDIQEAQASDEKLTELMQRRRDAYRGVFDTLLKHEDILKNLYKPLVDSLEKEEGSLGKLTFTVQRIVDVKKWAEQGEQLLDLRKGNKFRGKGSLEGIVRKQMMHFWKKENADKIANAMATFLQNNERDIRQHSPYEKTDMENYRVWMKGVARWLYSTDHIDIKYSVQYEGVDIKQLSPGARGIVLLLLYLAIDKEDYRPLIIDQPEENLDPKSIFDELVPRFKAAKLRRQIIIVTHNANLVVNTDADQVIVASCGPHKEEELPDIKYISGGLENETIREKVCEILEGGSEAFKERAKRLRIKMRS